MTEEIKQKRDELAEKVEIPYFAKSLSERAGHIASFKDGFDEGFQLAQAEIERLKSELKDYYFTQEKYKESYEYGLKLKAEIEDLKVELNNYKKLAEIFGKVAELSDKRGE